LADAWSKLHAIQERAVELWAEFLESLIESTECTSDKARAARVRAIHKAEYRQRLWPKLRRYAKGEIHSGLSHIEVPVLDATQEIVGWRSVTSPIELFTTLIERNIQHFAQAKDTPFVNGILGSTFILLNRTIFQNPSCGEQLILTPLMSMML